jgi:uncharacterized protein (TIGR02246 family)
MTATELDVAALLGRLQVLEDRAALDDLVKRYAIGCDTRDAEVLRSTFTDDAVGTYAGTAPLVGVEAIVEWIGMMTAPAVWQQHMISPFAYEVDGDRAQVIAYLISHQNFDANPNVTTMMSSRYTLQCVRTDKGWRIKDLVLVVGWIESRFGDQSALP